MEFAGLDLQRLSRFAMLLHRHLPQQVVIGLQGTLGAGQTRLVQEIAVAAGSDRGDVTSPTFTIVQHYHGSRRIHHVDAYRLADEDEFIELGGEELFEDAAMVLIEWPQRISGSLPGNALWLEIEIDEDSDQGSDEDSAAERSPDQATRTIRASSADAGLMTILNQVAQEMDR